MIIALAVLAVYQVGQLWLVNLTNGNFGLYLQARFPPSAPDGQSAFAQPFRIVSGAGDGLFVIRYGGIAASEEWAFGEEAINAALRNGEFVAGEDFYFGDVISQRVLIYEYAFDMCAKTFARAMGHRNSAIITDAGIENFTSIVVQPTFFNPFDRNDAMRNRHLRVFFVNGTQVLGAFEYEYARLDIMSPPPFDFPIPAADPTELHFIATENGFVPRVQGEGFSYAAITVENPFRDARGMFTLSHIRSRVEHLFDNPASIFPSVSVDNVYTFSNRNTMVRYLENAVLEYTSYRTIGRAVQENFMTDFSAALAFVNADPFVKNEFYLKNHDTRGRAHIFRFNYVIENHPLVLTQPWHTRPYPRCNDPLFAPIEITVDQGRVIRYRRIVYTFHADGIMWKPYYELEHAEPFTLGFPIQSDGTIELTALLEE